MLPMRKRTKWSKNTLLLLTGLTATMSSGCTISGGSAPVTVDPCPRWLDRVAPIPLPAEEPITPEGWAFEGDVVRLNEAGARVGCWPAPDAVILPPQRP